MNGCDILCCSYLHYAGYVVNHHACAVAAILEALNSGLIVLRSVCCCMIGSAKFYSSFSFFPFLPSRVEMVNEIWPARSKSGLVLKD